MISVPKSLIRVTATPTGSPSAPAGFLSNPYLPDETALARARTVLTHYRANESLRRRDDLDQCPATSSTVLRRLQLIHATDLGRCPRILFLGDDDLFSLALAASAFRGHLTVLDADRALLDAIRHQPDGKSIELVHADLRQPFPDRLIGRFDAAFADPPYTLAGQVLFAHRAMLALSTTERPHFFLCGSRLYLTPAHLKDITAFLLDGGFDLVALRENFNEYIAPPDVLNDMADRGQAAAAGSFYSSLFHFVRSRPSSPPDLPLFARGNIYAYEGGNAEA